MTYRGILSIGLLSVVVFAYAVNLIRIDVEPDDGNVGVVSMAPISIGNPAVAATLALRLPHATGDQPAPRIVPATYTQTFEIGKGDTLARLLHRAGINPSEAHEAIEALSEYYNPRRIQRGQDVALTFRSAQPIPDGDSNSAGTDTFIGLSIEPDYKTEVTVERDDTGNFKAAQREKDLIRAPVRAVGSIDNSLYVSGRDAGVPAVVIARMIRILSWDVDFQRDIREGDTFEVMYERVDDENGRTVYHGNVLYAALTLSGKRLTVYRHKLADGTIDFFDDAGKATRKALMRTPIDGARLTSGFGKRRHPILGYTKMHQGVDFAAPPGTPIYAAGGGTIVYAGDKGGYGNYVMLRHNSAYQTAYGHLKGFARGIRAGKRVEQGQVIGYVGTTGRSTGPHLHYEIHLNNSQVNPLSVRMPSGRVLAGAELDKFLTDRKAADAKFAALGSNRVASKSE
ncbi:MAG: M23 family metallopeptidase [Proteobacteria bacterium]|nr:M23 family metallopeptidase [Pseudomonadota bacterium]